MEGQERAVSNDVDTKGWGLNPFFSSDDAVGTEVGVAQNALTCTQISPLHFQTPILDKG